MKNYFIYGILMILTISMVSAMTGNGTLEDPYMVYDTDDFLLIGKYVYFEGYPLVYYELANDIDVQGSGAANRGNTHFYVVVDNPYPNFSLEGNGYTVTTDAVLFSEVSLGYFSNFNIRVPGNDKLGNGYEFGGALMGNWYSGNITNVHVSIETMWTGSGLVDSFFTEYRLSESFIVNSSVTIQNGYSITNPEIDETFWHEGIGGLVGYYYSADYPNYALHIVDSYVELANTGGQVYIEGWDDRIVGGVVAFADTDTLLYLDNVRVIGNPVPNENYCGIFGERAIGGIVGKSLGTVVMNNVVNDHVQVEQTNMDDQHGAGGLIGEGTNTNITNSVNYGRIYVHDAAQAAVAGGIMGTSCDWNPFTVESFYAHLVNVTNYGNFTGRYIAHQEVGGIAGDFGDYWENGGSFTITDSANYGTLYAYPETSYPYLAGIISMPYLAVVERSVNHGDIISDRETNGCCSTMAGILGSDSDSVVIDSYNDGIIRAADSTVWIGGIVGSSQRTTATNVYSVMPANATYVDGLFGYGSATIISSYYDKDVFGFDDGVYGKTTAQMKTESTFVGWDFVNTWQICPEVNNGYPSLRRVDPACPAVVPQQSSSSGSGTRYLVDADGNVVGVMQGQQLVTQPSQGAPQLSIAGEGVGFDILAWLKELWITIKGWFG